MDILKDSKTPLGFRVIHNKLGSGSKSTLSKKLRLLQLQNIIFKTNDGKYQIQPRYDFSNIQNLKKLLDSLDNIIPDLRPKDKAYIGIKLWSTIFQVLSHPAESFLTNNFVNISDQLSESKHTKIIEEFFALQKFTNMYLNDMYVLFFDFCKKFSPEILDEVLSRNVFYKHNKLNSDNKDNILLAKQFHEEIFIQGFDYEIYYGIEFCNALLEVKPDALNETTLNILRKKACFQRINLIS